MVCPMSVRRWSHQTKSLMLTRKSPMSWDTCWIHIDFESRGCRRPMGWSGWKHTSQEARTPEQFVCGATLWHVESLCRKWPQNTEQKSRELGNNGEGRAGVAWGRTVGSEVPMPGSKTRISRHKSVQGLDEEQLAVVNNHTSESFNFRNHPKDKTTLTST